MEKLVSRYLSLDRKLTVLDIGSYDVNGCYRNLFSHPGWHYLGVDLTEGPNVDIVLKTAYRFPIVSNSVDLVISGQAFEHIEFFWITWLEQVRVLKPGGMIFLIVPSSGPEHRHPVDCWRFYPDACHALARYADLELLEVHSGLVSGADDASAMWLDTVGVFRKHQIGMWKKIRRCLLIWFTQIFTPNK